MQESNYFSAFTGKYILNNSSSGSGDPFKSYEAYRLVHERGTGNSSGGGNNKGGSAWIAGIMIVILFCIGGWLASKTDNKFLAAAILITVLALIFLISFMLIKALENNNIKAGKMTELIEDADPAKKEKSTKIKKVLRNKKGSIESA